MKIGVSLFLWTDFVEQQHFKYFEKLKAAGFDGVEIPLMAGDETHYKLVAQAIKNAGLECTTMSLGLPDKHLISQDPKARAAGLDFLKWAVDMSHLLGSKMLSGPLHSAPAIFTGNFPTEQEKMWAANGLYDLAEYAQQFDIGIAVEYLNHFESYLCNTMADTQALINLNPHANLGIQLDTHHAHYEENNMRDAIIHGGSNIKYVQISESNRGTPGAGLIDFNEVFTALKHIEYDGWLTVEAFSWKHEQLRKNLHLWRELYTSEKDCYSKGFELIRSYWFG
ncbi:sugar phosphate isomerase/epimerase [Paraglaciecola aquimarina]|uniref:Sugar phosphate isomerase/epimerase n=1 Tax=Paraglaciecola algarum TaxID=3050085 RepID=A0ABS9D148_9ALTE|nr:sugar phosphate isomerase/epimerase [Paraglaciecola sp. G1-23]MCF2946655.1 sugar phosphate isomerase/epimerase [Paraglaciecola sp. G1-23]